MSPALLPTTAATGSGCSAELCGKSLFASILCDACKRQFCTEHCVPANHACVVWTVSAPGHSTPSTPSTPVKAAKSRSVSASPGRERDAQLLDVGHQCSAPLCFVVDFLPLKCKYCTLYFCTDHFRVDGHKCEKYVERRFNATAVPSMTTPSPSPAALPVLTTSTPPPAPLPVCAREICGTVLFKPVRCTTCGQQFCSMHHFPANHTCVLSTTPAPVPQEPSVSVQLTKPARQGIMYAIREVFTIARLSPSKTAPPQEAPPLATSGPRTIPNAISDSRAVKGNEGTLQEQRKAVRLRSLDSSGLLGYLNGLGSSFIDRFKLSGQVGDIDQTIERLRKAVRLRSLDSHDLPAVLNDLGLSLTSRFERFGKVKDIEEAIKQQREAVRLTSLDSPALPMYLHSLGNSFACRFERFLEVKDIDEAIIQHREAVRLEPLDSPDLPMFLNSLGLSFSCRFVRFGVEKDNEEAIVQQREAVRLTPLGKPILPTYLHNLGTSFTYRFERLGSVQDLEEAIKQQRLAVRLMPLDGPALPMYLHNLGQSFMYRFERYGEVKDIDEAIRLQREGVRLTPLDSPDLPMYHNDLGNSLSCRRSGRFVKMKGVDEDACTITLPAIQDLAFVGSQTLKFCLSS